ncbi:MAG: ATP-binding cassette domain-containing protein [Candidatus Rokubacteria bacterium]|nr:ATP-binding cassette domain-containing protein [Candidatus Rokubacteria bacterium]
MGRARGGPRVEPRVGLIRLERVDFGYGRARVLRGLDLAVPERAITVLVGPSGSGKTSVLRLIAGFEAPARGAIEIGGEVASRDGRVLLPPEARGVGMVFQDLALWPHMTVRQTLEFVLGRDPAGEERRRRIAETLEAVGLERHAGARPAQLRAAVEPRPAAPPGADRGDPPAPAGARPHDPLRHPRDRGDLPARRPGRDHARRADRASRRATRALRAPAERLRRLVPGAVRAAARAGPREPGRDRARRPCAERHRQRGRRPRGDPARGRPRERGGAVRRPDRAGGVAPQRLAGRDRGRRLAALGPARRGAQARSPRPLRRPAGRGRPPAFPLTQCLYRC